MYLNHEYIEASEYIKRMYHYRVLLLHSTITSINMAVHQRRTCSYSLSRATDEQTLLFKHEPTNQLKM
jgi:hypothetical protein